MNASLRRAALVLPFVALPACSWFTDFKEQPKIDPWDTPHDTIPPRANPQGSIPVGGQSAPNFMYDRSSAGPAGVSAFTAMASIPNPVPADSASVARGRMQYQINCAVCHGNNGTGGMTAPISKWNVFGADLAGPNSATRGYTDGYIFAIIRNGKNLMPSYARIEEHERWDIVNYMRALQGAGTVAADTTLSARPGETGRLVPGASRTAPTRPAPFFRAGAIGAPAAHLDTAAAHRADSTAGRRSDSTATRPPAPPVRHDNAPGARP